jgi:hypothetical protein
MLRSNRVTSVYFQNGSSFDVAKIEGSPSYKHLMRAAIPCDDTELGERPDAHDGDSASYLEVLQTTLLPQSLRRRRRTWLGGRDQRVQTLAGMMKALKVAAESYLESSVCTGLLDLPLQFSEPYYQVLRKASNVNSLGLQLLRTNPAGIHAADAYGLSGDCSDDLHEDPEKLILTVEYSRAAVTALLLDEDCGVYEWRRAVHSTRLGLDGISDGSEATWSDLERLFRQITELPLKSGNGAGLKHIGNIVLFGESAGDSRLQNALRNVLGERYNSFTRTGGAAQPAFASARCLAYYSWIRLQERPPWYFGPCHVSSTPT